ncbi:MAG TPA: polysaccharide pyruvyl transferase family protein, partial [Gammaproteobacteria bacterium]|nr:polysaccharide pyruvyl transferase family protein [Gammaproteobacteria bacterium]
MKMVISNIVVMNAGDAAILLAMKAMFREVFGAGLEITVFDKNPAYASSRYPGIRFRESLYFQVTDNPRWLSRIPTATGRVVGRTLYERAMLLLARIAIWKVQLWGGRVPRLLMSEGARDGLQQYAEADLVVSAGGTYLVEQYSLAPRLFDYEVTHALGKPLYFFTQSMGPFRARGNRRRLRKALDGARMVFLRDEDSRRNVEDLGPVGCTLIQSADAAFGLADAREITLGCRRGASGSRGLRVGVSVREWGHFATVSHAEGMERYRSGLAGAIERLVTGHDARALFVSTCQGVPEPYPDDSTVAAEIVQRIPEGARSGTELLNGFLAPPAIRKVLRDCDFVIATRMHMAILALSVGTPVLPIA